MDRQSVDALREELRCFLKLQPAYRSPTVRVVERADEDGYIRSLLRYHTADHDQVDAFLFEPAGGLSRGAILALHQHNSQWEIGKSEIAGLLGDPLQAFGPALALRGVTVLAPDAIGFESRLNSSGWGATLAPKLDRPHSTVEGWLQYYNEMAYRIVRGECLMTKILHDCFTALQILRSATKILRPGVLGHSFGGSVALFLAAVDETVPFACSSGALCSYRQKMASGTALEMSLVIPGFQTKFDLAEVLRCVAPRRMLIVSADKDPQTADAPRVVEQARPEFVKQGAGFDLLHVHTLGGHPLDQYRFDTIVNWTAKQAHSHSGHGPA
jgi:dienelactone hydrolase